MEHVWSPLIPGIFMKGFRRYNSQEADITCFALNPFYTCPR